MSKRAMIVLTGGPGGGKSTFIEDLRNDPSWSHRFVALPEAAHFARFASISPTEKLFQRVIVRLQMTLEDELSRALDSSDCRPIICHRGSLDPLAFWLKYGWQEDEFFAYTGTTREEHYLRYAIVIHLVTSADGVPSAYTRWPQAHRPEEADEAIQLDHWLQQAWSSHPSYYRIDNVGRDWITKSYEAKMILDRNMAD